MDARGRATFLVAGRAAALPLLRSARCCPTRCRGPSRGRVLIDAAFGFFLIVAASVAVVGAPTRPTPATSRPRALNAPPTAHLRDDMGHWHAPFYPWALVNQLEQQ
jgi:hypothetical protein